MSEVALITGASRGIGREIALEFAKKGYNIVINYRSDAPELEPLKKELEEYNIKTLFVQGDVTEFEKWEGITKKVIETFGQIDVLVNNAGITKDTLFLRMSEEDFEKVINVNLKGTFNVTKHVIPYMTRERHGKIINIASVVGVTGNSGQANYAASKAGIIGLTKTLAREFASRNILVNAVAPGFIETDMTNVLSSSIKENILNGIPLKKMGTAKDVAKLVCFLGSEDNTYITGQVINIDGGMVM